MATAVSSSRGWRVSRHCWKRRPHSQRADSFHPATGCLGRIDRVRESRGTGRESEPMATAEELAALVRSLADPNGYARARAAETLLTLRDPAATPLLIDALDSGDDGTRSMAARILGENGDVSAADALIA